MRQKLEGVDYFKFLQLAFLLATVLLASCDDRQEENWIGKDIQNPILVGTGSCTPPCWQGFEIGITSFDQALMRMKEFQTQNPGSRLLIGDFKEYITLASKTTEIVMHFENELLFYITFGSSTVDLGSIVAHYGLPEKYYITEDRFGYILHIYYPKNGTIFLAVNDFSPIKKAMIVDQFTFYDPEYNLDSFLEQFYGYDLDQISERFFQWQGFGVCPEGLEFPENCN